MSAAALLRVQKLGGPGIVRKASSHNLRTIRAETRDGLGGRIDPTRIPLNTIMAGSNTPVDVVALANARMAAAGVKKLRKNGVAALEFVVSLPPDQVADEGSFFKDALGWIAQRFGGIENVLSAVIHRDEPAPHLHVLMLPLFAGRMQGSDAVGGPSQLRQLQGDFFDAVAKRHGLRKPSSRCRGVNKVDVAKAIFAALQHRCDPSLSSVLWPGFRADIEADPWPYADMLDLDLPTLVRPKKLRSSTAIFTSKGKGSQRREDETPRRASAPLSPQTLALCMVSSKAQR